LDIPFTLPGTRDGTRELAVVGLVAWLVLDVLLRWTA
jgi:hypothetical protein